MPHQGTCDNCGGNKQVSNLHLPDNQVLELCKPCWSKEMAWRKLRNQDLHPSARFPIRAFPLSTGVRWY